MPPPGRTGIGAVGSLPSISCQQRMSSLPGIEACEHFPTMKMHFFCSSCEKCFVEKGFQQRLHGKCLSFGYAFDEFQTWKIPFKWMGIPWLTDLLSTATFWLSFCECFQLLELLLHLLAVGIFTSCPCNTTFLFLNRTYSALPIRRQWLNQRGRVPAMGGQDPGAAGRAAFT